MSLTDLEFYQTPLSSGDLVFGDTSAGGPPVTAEFLGQMPGLSLTGHVAEIVKAYVAAQMPGLTMTAVVNYDNRLTRYMQGLRTASHQTAEEARPSFDAGWDTSASFRSNTSAVWQRAVRSGGERDAAHTTAVSTRNTRSVPHQTATSLFSSRESRMETGVHLRNTATTRHQRASHLKGKTVEQLLQVASLVRDTIGGNWQTAIPFKRPTAGVIGASLFQIGQQATVGKWQVALHLQAGAHPAVVVPPPGHICYTPSGDLVFVAQQSDSTSLLFRCDGAELPPTVIVVPVRKAYMVTNNVQLRRVSDNALIPCDSASLSLDVDSWTWGFNASMPGEALSLVRPDNGPVEVKLNVNGSEVRLLVESVSRDRTFGSTSLKVSGRGINAELDAPYAGTQVFGSYATLTAQQLMEQVLTLNNIPLGWALNWQIEDWLVPAGVFNHQGTYISALNAISGAAGAYIQPSLASATIAVKHRYPLAPWEWAGATPDIVLPSDVVVQEGLTWLEKPPYTRVYVSGEGSGVLGRVTRAGTSGDVLAPMVTDQLIVANEAARQRGRAVLSDTGKQVRAALGLPVLPETGMILPGTFIQYEDGDVTRKGLVRSLNVSLGFPNVWQSIEVETHV